MQVLKAYQYRDGWVNRLILSDSFVVLISQLEYEGLGGQVQMIYIDAPYGVKFRSNVQPFVRKRDVTHNDEADLTRGGSDADSESLCFIILNAPVRLSGFFGRLMNPFLRGWCVPRQWCRA